MGVNALGFMNLYVAGFSRNVKRIKVDYSEYLGPDWKLTYDNHCSMIFNHVSWWDIPLIMSFANSSFVAKEGTKDLIFVGTISKETACVYFDRGDKDSRKGVMEVLQTRLA